MPYHTLVLTILFLKFEKSLLYHVVDVSKIVLDEWQTV